MAKHVIKDGTNYEVIGSEGCMFYVIMNDVAAGEEYYSADAHLNSTDGLWYVSFTRCLNSGEFWDKVLYEFEDVPVYLMSDRPYEDRVRTEGMSFKQVTAYMWKVMKCLNTKKYVEEV